ncbi:hypothetical protein D3C75_687810 [compost metagenome]
MINLYTNAIEHSELSFEKLIITIDVSEIEKDEALDLLRSNKSLLSEDSLHYLKEFEKSNFDILKIRVHNNLNSEINLEVVQSRLSDAINKVKNPEQYRKDVVEEGGSGLLKINNLLKYNLSALFFYIYKIERIDDGFTAEYYINLESLISEREDENALITS